MAINTFNESELHAALKRRYAQPGDEFEGKLEGYVIDVIQRHPRTGNVQQLIEVQTSSFYNARDKWRDLASRHRLRVIHPIALERSLVTYSPEGELLSTRKSPCKGRIEHVFDELVTAPDLIDTPNFSLELALTREQDVRVREPTRKRRWLRNYRKVGRRLISVDDWIVFECGTDLLQLIQPGLVQPFGSAELAAHWHCDRALAQRAIYCLRELNLLRHDAGSHKRPARYSIAS